MRWYIGDVWYELWDAETNNRVGRFETEDAALAAVREDVQRYGRDADAVTSLGLIAHDPARVAGGLIAEGPALVERALARGRQSPQQLSA